MNSLGRVNGVVKQNEYNLCEKKEGMMSEMPLDIVGKIFDFAEDVPPMNTIKRSWCESKIFTPGAKEYLPEELITFEIGKYLNTEDMKNFLSVNNSSMKYKENSFIAKRLQVAHILQQAKNVINCMPEAYEIDAESLKRSIAVLQAMYSSIDCKETLEKIKIPSMRALAALEIAKVDPAYITTAKQAALEIKNNDYYKAEMLLDIAKVDPKHDLTEVRLAADGTLTLHEKAKILIEIAKIDPSHDIKRAKEVVGQMEEDVYFSKVEMLLEIAKVDPDHDVKAAKEAVLQIQNNDYYKAEMLLEIAKVDPKRDLTAAKEAVLQIQNNFYNKAEMLLEIAKIDPKRDLTAAKQEADQIDDVCEKTQMQLKIAIVDPKSVIAEFVTAAKKAVEEKENNPYEKVRMLLEIAKIHPEQDLTSVKEAIKDVKENSSWKVEMLLDTAKLDPNCVIAEYVAAAKQIADQIDDHYDKSQALLLIAKMDPKSVIAAENYVAAAKEYIASVNESAEANESAEKQADEMENSNDSIQVQEDALRIEAINLLEIVKIQASYDLRAAENTAEDILTRYEQAQALIVIAGFYLKSKA